MIYLMRSPSTTRSRNAYEMRRETEKKDGRDGARLRARKTTCNSDGGGGGSGGRNQLSRAFLFLWRENDPRTSSKKDKSGRGSLGSSSSSSPVLAFVLPFSASAPPRCAAFIPGKLRSPRPRASSKVHVKVAATFRAARSPEHRQSAAFLTTAAARIVNVAPLIDRAGTCANGNGGGGGGNAEKSSRAFSNEHLLPFPPL